MALSAQLLPAAPAGAQDINRQVVQLQLNDATLLDAFRQIESQTAFRFMYRKADVSGIRHLSLPAGKQYLPDVLQQLLGPAALSFRQVDNKILIRPAGIVTPSTATADSIATVTGQVTGDDGQPVIGATVILKGTQRGAVTDQAGRFLLRDVPAGAVLLVSSLGYRPLEIALNGRTYVTLQLARTNGSRLNEVVVVGYGTQQKKEITGSIAKVGTLNPEENMVNNPISALQGRVAGLSVTSTGAMPGSMPRFTIRGLQTTQNNYFGAGSNPLLVIDGLVIDAAPEGENANFSMFNLNPQDIASIEVLKDAASAAIYGARGAQGVIMITTKKGSFGTKPVVTINSYWGSSSSRFNYRPLNSSEYAMMFREARQNRIGDIDRRLGQGGLTPGQIAALGEEKELLGLQISQLKMGKDDINWLNKVMPRSAPTSNIQASVSGGSEKTGYYLSFGKFSESSATGIGRLNRYSGKLALTQQLTRWLRAGADVSISKVRKDGLSEAMSPGLEARPDTPDSLKTNPDGTWGYWYSFQPHPYGALHAYHKNLKDNWNYTGNFFAEATIAQGLSFRTMVAGSRSEVSDEQFVSPFSYDGQGVQGDYLNRGNSGLRYTINNLLTYRFNYRQLKADVLLGQEFTGNQYKTTAFNNQGFPLVPQLWKPGNGSIATNYYLSSNRFYEDYTESWFLRSNMSWDGRYLLSFSLRRDGSSKLEDNRYAWFPAISGGWLLSEEPFLQGNEMLSYLKLRSSYGITGNIRPLDLYDTEDLVNSVLYLNKPALRMNTTLGNPDLKWERTRQHDIGLEARFFRDRLALTVEYYVKKTDGLLTSRQVPWSSGGFTSQRVNLGAMENRGLDLSVSYGNKPLAAGAFRWEVGAVANINRNRVTQLRDSVMSYGGYYFTTGPQGFIRVGQPAGLLYLYKSLGVDPQTGDLVYEDRNKDGVINDQDRIYVPVAQPKITGGLNIDLSWKGFGLSSQFAFTLGNKIYNYSDQLARSYDLDIYTGEMSNRPNWALNRWQKPGDHSYYPRAVTGVHGAGQTTDWNFRHSTHYLFSGSYLRCRNITFSYNLPAAFIRKGSMQQVRLYVAAQNVFTIKDKALLTSDPEQALEAGVQQTVAPMPRAVSAGFDIKF